MATNWFTPSASDLLVFMDTAVVSTISAGNQEDAVEATVARIRGAVQACGRQPLSVTPGTVPPEARQHSAVMAVSVLVASKPQLAQVVDSDGNATVFGELRDKAEDWLEKVLQGDVRVTQPSDPTGEDYRTAVGEDNPLWQGVRYGSLAEEVDLTTFPTEIVGEEEDTVQAKVYELTLGVGVEGGAVTFDTLDHVPFVMAQVTKPVGGYNIFATPFNVTESGFEFSLTGITDSADYKLVYQVK